MAARPRDRTAPAIERIHVSGFKSIGSEQSIDIKPLTLLAGANSSGKSSMMQALLLLKQSLESTYDPGPLLLPGPNVKFHSASEMFSKCRGVDGKLRIGIELRSEEQFEVAFGWNRRKKQIELDTFDFKDSIREFTLSNSMTPGSIAAAMAWGGKKPAFSVVRDRFFLNVYENVSDPNGIEERIQAYFRTDWYFTRSIESVIHLPGLRGNPERSYLVSATGEVFPGTFENYAASIVADWNLNDLGALGQLGEDLAELGLTWKIIATAVNETQVELRVARLPRGGAEDLVNIADVGFGVSQTLPVLVALLAARPGQLVYIEQPETHLHPRAQVAMAGLLARAAKRGVLVVCETHSSLLLLSVQALVADGALAPDKVKLHWFRRDKEGSTIIKTADLDEAGRFGDWPEDFADVTLELENRYLSAAEKRLAEAKGNGKS